jgi:hypothetical protein
VAKSSQFIVYQLSSPPAEEVRWPRMSLRELSNCSKTGHLPPFSARNTGCGILDLRSHPQGPSLGDVQADQPEADAAGTESLFGEEVIHPWTKKARRIQLRRGLRCCETEDCVVVRDRRSPRLRGLPTNFRQSPAVGDRSCLQALVFTR